MLKHLIIVGAGGAIGSIIRYLINYFTKPGTFPFATLFINISGSLIIGLIMGLAAKQSFFSSEWKLFLVAGICGGFTTYSAFSYENLQLLQNGKIITAFLYILLSVVLGISAAWIGFKFTS